MNVQPEAMSEKTKYQQLTFPLQVISARFVGGVTPLWILQPSKF